MSNYLELFNEKLPNSRSEHEVFSELEKLCLTPGFVHVIAKLCLRDHAIKYEEELEYESLAHQRSNNSLLRTEMSTLICLMLKGEHWAKEIEINQVTALCSEADSLLQDLHVSIYKSSNRDPKASQSPVDKMWLKEAIFYAGESAYCSQYLDLSESRYSFDDPWLIANKQFTAKQASHITRSIQQLLNTKLSERFSKVSLLEDYEEW